MIWMSIPKPEAKEFSALSFSRGQLWWGRAQSKYLWVNPKHSVSSRALGKDADFTANVIFQISISDMHGGHGQPRSITEGPGRDFHKPYSFLTGHFLHEHLLWLLIKVALRGPKVGELGNLESLCNERPHLHQQVLVTSHHFGITVGCK